MTEGDRPVDVDVVALLGGERTMGSPVPPAASSSPSAAEGPALEQFATDSAENAGIAR